LFCNLTGIGCEIWFLKKDVSDYLAVRLFRHKEHIMTSPITNFPGENRVHIALGATDLAASIAFYRVLFGVEPNKQRADYARFTPADPSLNLSLNQVATAIPTSQVQHFGIQVKSSQAVTAMVERLRAANLPAQVEEAVTCCYAEQDKVWTIDPSGHRWEVFVTNDDTATVPSANRQAQQSCCPTAGVIQSCCLK
jgi:catechol 2,3-dioxygenase-like lactoylglutathione lyase family enzyme